MVISIDDDSDMPECLNTWDKQASKAKQLVDLHCNGALAKDVRAPYPQGCFSRTVIVILQDGKELVVQFRPEPLDLAPFELARKTLGELVPEIRRIFDEELDQLRFWVYFLTMIPGQTWLATEKSHEEDITPALVHSLACVLAKCWLNNDSTAVVDNQLRQHLHLIQTSDDPEIRPFSDTARDLFDKLDSLKALPLFLSHCDLNAMNIMVENDRLQVSGLIDWEYSTPLPFGVGLARILTLIGEFRYGEFHMEDDFEDVERTFWDLLLAKVPESTRTLCLERPELLQTAMTLGTLFDTFQLYEGKLGLYNPVAVRALPKLLSYRVPLIRMPEAPPFLV
ncbi:hypothetical protein ANO11243_075010 [Dothideomycetidae sp. 11243]|nr:hypothetical protein ANO11243_075010 [fungal sp. No.11243]